MNEHVILCLLEEARRGLLKLERNRKLSTALIELETAILWIKDDLLDLQVASKSVEPIQTEIALD